MVKSGQRLREKILSQYEKEGNDTVRNMLNIVARAQHKIDSKAYREALEKIEKKQ